MARSTFALLCALVVVLAAVDVDVRVARAQTTTTFPRCREHAPALDGDLDGADDAQWTTPNLQVVGGPLAYTSEIASTSLAPDSVRVSRGVDGSLWLLLQSWSWVGFDPALDFRVLVFANSDGVSTTGFSEGTGADAVHGADVRASLSVSGTTSSHTASLELVEHASATQSVDAWTSPLACVSAATDAAFKTSNWAQMELALPAACHCFGDARSVWVRFQVKNTAGVYKDTHRFKLQMYDTTTWAVATTSAPADERAPLANGQWAVYYDEPSACELDELSRYSAVVVQSAFGAANVATLRAAGVDVLCYLSVGEEPANVGAPVSGSGASTFSAASGVTTVTSGASASVASYYIDGGFVENNAIVAADGVLETNSQFGGRSIRPTAEWIARLKSETKTTGSFAGVDQLLGTGTGDYACSGLLLDTLDTAAPFSSPAYFGWTAPDFHTLLTELRSYVDANYAGATLMANRGLSLFNPQQQYDPRDATNAPLLAAPIASYSSAAASAIDYLLFESFSLASGTSDGDAHTAYTANNRVEWAPKVSRVAETHGFAIVALDFQSGDGDSSCAFRSEAQREEAFNASYVARGWQQFQSPLSTMFGTPGLDDVDAGVPRIDYAAALIDDAPADVDAPVFEDASATGSVERTLSSIDSVAVDCTSSAITFKFNGARDRSTVTYEVHNASTTPSTTLLYTFSRPGTAGAALTFALNDDWATPSASGGEEKTFVGAVTFDGSSYPALYDDHSLVLKAVDALGNSASSQTFVASCPSAPLTEALVVDDATQYDVDTAVTLTPLTTTQAVEQFYWQLDVDGGKNGRRVELTFPDGQAVVVAEDAKNWQTVSGWYDWSADRALVASDTLSVEGNQNGAHKYRVRNIEITAHFVTGASKRGSSSNHTQFVRR